MTKYGDMIEDHEWSDPEPDGEPPDRTRVKKHELDVYFDAEPDPEDNYGRERYTVKITYDDETGAPSVLFAIKHRWKGNYWRDTHDYDWQDVPVPVRQQVAAVLPVDGPDALDSGVRLIDEGGESRYEKYHKPRIESMSGDEMWGTSYLREAMERAEGAAEAFDEGSDGEERAEELVQSIQDAIREFDGRDSERA